MALRNELRPPLLNQAVSGTYNWSVWATHMRDGAKAINDATPNPLIFLSGLDGDVTFQEALNGTDAVDFTSFPGAGAKKLVLELHVYDFVAPVTDCNQMKSDKIKAGFSILTGPEAKQMPLVVTEFGYDQTEYKTAVIATCTREFLPEQQVGWFVWLLGGSYYIREGTQDVDDAWGLLDHDWQDWRSEEAIHEGLVPMINATLAWGTVQGKSGSGSGGAGPGSGGGGGSSGNSGGNVAAGLHVSMLLLSLPLIATAYRLLWGSP